MSRIVVLGAGESGAGAAVLAKVKGFDTFVSDMSAIKDVYKRQYTTSVKSRSVLWQPKPWAVSMPIQPWEPVTALNWPSTPC